MLYLRETIACTNGAIDELKFTGKLKLRFRKVISSKSTDGSVTGVLSLRWIPSTNKKFKLHIFFLILTKVFLKYSNLWHSAVLLI